MIICELWSIIPPSLLFFFMVNTFIGKEGLDLIQDLSILFLIPLIYYNKVLGTLLNWSLELKEIFFIKSTIPNNNVDVVQLKQSFMCNASADLPNVGNTDFSLLMMVFSRPNSGTMKLLRIDFKQFSYCFIRYYYFQVVDHVIWGLQLCF